MPPHEVLELFLLRISTLIFCHMIRTPVSSWTPFIRMVARILCTSLLGLPVIRNLYLIHALQILTGVTAAVMLCLRDDLSDHLPVFSFFLSVIPNKQRNQSLSLMFYRNTSDSNITRFLSLAKVNWIPVLQENNTNVAYSLLIRILKNLYDAFFPLKSA